MTTQYDDGDTRIYHDNSLWRLFRLLAEETEIPESVDLCVRNRIGAFKYEA